MGTEDKKFKVPDLPEIKDNNSINHQKLSIYPIVGRANFKCKFLQETEIKSSYSKEKNARLTDIFEGAKPVESVTSHSDSTCDNNFLPCKIEIKEKNLPTIKDFIKRNPDVKINDFDRVSEIRRMTIAPICPYWSPIVPEEFEIKKFKDSKKIKYLGLNNIMFTIYQRKTGCPYYDQYKAYADSDVIIFNSLKF